MTQFIVHVGPHKTGTTYLQECFAQVRSRLAERGIHFPNIWGPSAHHALYDKLLNVPNAQLESEFAELHAGRHNAVLISVEGLTFLPEPSVAYFRRLVGAENPLRCIFYARAWADVLPSHWKEEVKGGEVETFPEYIHHRLHSPMASSFVNFGIGLKIWAKYFGLESISIVAYNQLIAFKCDLFTHFAQQFLDWAAPPQPNISHANVSPGVEDIEVIRTIATLERQRLGRPLVRGYAVALSDCYMRRRGALVTPAVDSALKQHQTSLVINETNATLTALHRDLVLEFGNSLVMPRLPNAFFSPRRAEVPYVQSDWLLTGGVINDINTIHQTIYAEVEASGCVNTERRLTPAPRSARAGDIAPKGVAAALSNDQAGGDRVASDLGRVTVIRGSRATLAESILLFPRRQNVATISIFSTIFGREGDANRVQRRGWSGGENGFTWAVDSRSTLLLHLPRVAAHFLLLQFSVNPYVANPGPARQAMRISINDSESGVVELTGPSLIECEMPLPMSGALDALCVTFDMPDAARPSDFIAGSPDRRLLGASFAWLRVLACITSGDTLTGGVKLLGT